MTPGAAEPVTAGTPMGAGQESTDTGSCLRSSSWSRDVGSRDGTAGQKGYRSFAGDVPTWQSQDCSRAQPHAQPHAGRLHRCTHCCSASDAFPSPLRFGFQVRLRGCVTLRPRKSSHHPEMQRRTRRRWEGPRHDLAGKSPRLYGHRAHLEVFETQPRQNHWGLTQGVQAKEK